MKEKKKEDQPQPKPADSGVFDKAPAIPPPPPAPILVSSGPYAESIAGGGLSVGQIREKFADRLDIDEAAQGVVDGKAVSDDVIVKPGQSLMFVKQAGAKGL